MRGAPAWQRRRSGQHPSSVSALRADPPSPTRGEGESKTRTDAWTYWTKRPKGRRTMPTCGSVAACGR
ncbi:hypothetical protein EH240_06540 [Mesorhizobium tamadayense]|uniref:Uncharacterized protein n=1 Tax=Mesorhizobium tamadayense TaxID=425306 RepID=A0A3P3G5H7_9HYPH|nr:hypothetical protein EH240_06540 [Mesorhizobium tamadayense]